MREYKRCKLISPKYAKIPGAEFTCHGYHWIVQANGDAVAMIYAGSIPGQVAAGRFIVLEDEPKVERSLLIDIGMDIGNYFGMGSLDKFKEKMAELKPAGLSEFANTRFSVVFPEKMTKKEMLQEIHDLVNPNLPDSKLEDLVSDLDYNAKPEPSKKKPGRPKK